MKKIFAVALTVLLFLVMPFNISVFAVSNTYDLDELELQVTIPNGYSVITRDTPANDPIFSTLGITKSALVSQFETSNIYLNAISDTYNEEIVVTNMKNDLSNFSLLSDTVLNTFAATLVNQYSDYGISVSKYEIYQHSQAKFIKVYFTDTANSVYGLQYYTIYDGKAMNFTMRSYEGNISSRQETTIKTVVDSIKYDKAPPVADQGEDTNSFIYTDTDSGVTFTVPANWKQEAFSKDREFIDAKFVSTKEDGALIIYGSTDMWSMMSASDKVGYTRSDLNNSAFTKTDIAEMFSATADEISVVTYNGIQYYKCELTGSQEAYGLDFSITMTELVYIDNGWMYTFQFGGTSTHKLYSDFESLLNSVQYPTISNVAGVGSSNTSSLTDSTSNNSDSSSGAIAVILLLLIIAIIVVSVIIYNKKNNKTVNTVNHTPNYNEFMPEPTNSMETTIYCKKCGQSLLSDSDFCHMCGTKIFKDDDAK